MGVVGYSQLTIAVNASAYWYGCVMALDKTAGSAVSLGGSTVNLSNCSLVSNSSSASAVYVGGSANLTALPIAAVGGVSASASNGTLTNGTSVQCQIVCRRRGAELQRLQGHQREGQRRRYAGSGRLLQRHHRQCERCAHGQPRRLYSRPPRADRERRRLRHGSGVTLIFISSTGSNWARAS
jgi:hypothetical protein